MESNAFSELDLALLNALQVDPRAEWSRMAAALGVQPATLARHWEGIRARGLAWIALTAGHRYEQVASSAFVRVGCAAEDRAALTEALAEEPEAATVAATMGSHQFLLDVLVPDLTTLRGYLDERLPRLPGVRDIDSLLITRVYRAGTQWRLGTLDPDQLRHLHRGPDTWASPFAVDDVDRALIAELTRDGRAGWAALGAATGISAPTARRRITRMIRADVIELRCEVAQPIVGPAVQVTFLMRVPGDRLDAAGGVLGAMPRCRLAAAVAGPQNLLATLWLSTAADINRVERTVLGQVPGLEVHDRIVHLRAVKRVGHVLDTEEASRRVVPLAVW
ncbi:Lrp/AsnC family transcriptional regulator [Nocardioides ginsengisoli]|uniref:AsnC family transcriptional regulator n=1 Tax=Nocardioides ginsengisoli TaxID=363868 RepID=A0ABW3VYX4_9ACTN